MTKVLRKIAEMSCWRVVWLAACVVPCFVWAVGAQDSAQLSAGHAAERAEEHAVEHPAATLYQQLGHVELDPTRVFRVRGASMDRSEIHITLEDGTIAFTQDVMGHITGAFFEGEGEVLLVPPNEMERKSISLFTGMAILEERFATAYFRFNDDTANELKPGLRAADDGKEFVERWQSAARNLAQYDAMRLLLTFSKLLPTNGSADSAVGVKPSKDIPDRMLHGRIQGTKLGVFDIYFDSLAEEHVQAGQVRTAANGTAYYDLWTSFSMNDGDVASGPRQSFENVAIREKPREEPIVTSKYVITAEVRPPKEIYAEARLQLDVKQGGNRTLIFELSHFLKVEGVELNGRPIEYIHNPAGEGSQTSRRENDLVAVILPEPARAGDKFELRFVYGGEVLAEAGSGLLYVGARGTWYPNRGLAMANFDLEFHYPAGWTLVATGKPSGTATGATGLQVARYISERPIPVVGFNLGKYKVSSAHAGNVLVETYATPNVERDFPQAAPQVIAPIGRDPVSQPRNIQVVTGDTPSPARNAQAVTDMAAHAVQYFSERFGPYPYSRLSLTQMPGRESQGWPGLVFLSSYAFLNEEDRQQLHMDPFRTALQQQVPAHETAHQWWGDLITWSSYRDQWFSEGLANYSSLMMLQERDPKAFKVVMDVYRADLLQKNSDGISPADVGPVTLGARLLSSHSPQGYEAISYGRGTWLFHMLRMMLKDAEQGKKGGSGEGADEPFVRALRKVRKRYEGKSISTHELLDVFAEELPPSLHYEGKRSLDWFLEGWVNGSAVPRLELRDVRFTAKAGTSVVSATIFQKNAPDDLVTSVPVYGVVSGKDVLVGRVFADGAESTFQLNVPAGVKKIVLDPNDTVLSSPK